MDKSSKDTLNAIGNLKFVFEIIGIAIMFYIIVELIAPLNNERFIENWSLGLTFLMIFSALYIVPFEKLIFKPKRLYKFLIVFWLSYFIADFYDFIDTINRFLSASISGV